MNKKFYIIGFPESGKTSFIGALGYYLISGSKEVSELQLDEVNDMEYINKIAKEWVECKKADRTSKNILYYVSLNLVDKQKNKINVSLPDQSGEMFRDIINNRFIEEEQYVQLTDCEEVLVFINPSKIKKDTLIPEIPIMIREGGEDNKVEFANKHHSNISIQSEYVQMLKYLYFIRNKKTHIKVIVSAWDMYDKFEYKKPEQVLKDKLPLVWQYLYTNKEYFECEYWGISAQGGNLDDEKVQKQLAEYDNPNERILIVNYLGERLNDITKILV